MKKSPKNIDAKTTADTERAPSKRTTRLTKKTVLTIAPVDTSIEHYDVEDEKEGRLENGAHRLETTSNFISPELATTFACKLMAIALQLRTWSRNADENVSINEMMECALDSFEEAGNLSTEVGGLLPRLQSLLSQLHRDQLSVRARSGSDADEQAKQILLHALHAVIASISQNTQFEQAVENASQRAIYQFAYGLTHEINNPLANIVARAQQLIPTASSESDRRSLATIVDQSMRAHEMLAEMMRVVQPRSIQPRVEDLIAIVQHAMTIQEPLWSNAQMQCVLRKSPKPLYSSVERAAILEVICSLLQNAMQACRPKDRIEIICEEVNADHPDYGPSDPIPKAHVEPVSRIRIAVRDTGPGMSSEATERAWDLYYSGREHGRGLGISLANVRRTIDAHCGLVWIQSTPNAGCRVEIRLPKSPEPPSPRRAFSI